MVEFKPADQGAWNKPGGGRKFTPIPEEIFTWLQRTHETGTYCEIPIGDSSPEDVNSVIRMAKIACRRMQKSFQYDIDPTSGVLRVRMRDKRPYNRVTQRNRKAS